MTIVTYERVSHHTTRNDHSYLRARNQPISEKPILQIDFAAFQVVVTTAMIAVMAQANANNPKRNGNGVDNSNHSNNQGHQRVVAYKDTLNHKPKNMKRKFWNANGGSSIQGPT